jgi:hypothetical protein
MDGFWDFFWFIISVFFLMAYLLVLFQILGDLMRDRSTSGGAKALWVVGLIFLPVLTAVVYFVVRGPGMTQRATAEAQSAQADVDAYIRSVSSDAASPTAEIARAKALLDSGVISSAEFETLKSKALAG